MAKLKIEPHDLDPGKSIVTAEGCGASITYIIDAPPKKLKLMLKAHQEVIAKLGPWQVLEVAIPLVQGKRVPATAARLVRDRAAQYLGRYQRALERAAAAMGARFVPGPRGGKWLGYYIREDK